MQYQRLTRRELIAIAQALGALAILPSCTGGDSDSSINKDLTNNTSTTVVPQERVTQVVQQYQMANWVQSGGEQQEVFKQLAAVPDVYLAFLLKRANDVGFNIQFGGQAGGMCYFDNVGATKITLNSVEFATIHEVGHGVEYYAHELQNISDGSSMRERTYQSVRSSAEAQYIRAYAKSNSKELWADGFSSFYRSPQSRADMQKMPVTYQYLKSVLVAPINLGPGENPADFIGGSTTATQPATTNSAMAVENPAPTTGVPATPATGTTTATGTTPPATTPTSTVPTSTNPTDLCATPVNELVALACQLSAQLAASGAFGLTNAAQIIMPSANQFLTAYDRFLLMASMQLTASEASRVKVYLDRTVVANGLEVDKYAGRDDFFSVMFRVPVSLTPQRDYVPMTLRLVLDNSLLAETKVRVSRYSLCGDISDFKTRG